MNNVMAYIFNADKEIFLSTMLEFFTIKQLSNDGFNEVMAGIQC